MNYIMCRECEGTGVLQMGRCGGNDPHTINVTCDVCDGAGEVEEEEEEEEGEPRQIFSAYARILSAHARRR